jgi:hypothetical protein
VESKEGKHRSVELRTHLWFQRQGFARTNRSRWPATTHGDVLRFLRSRQTPPKPTQSLRLFPACGQVHAGGVRRRFRLQLDDQIVGANFSRKKNSSSPRTYFRSQSSVLEAGSFPTGVRATRDSGASGLPPQLRELDASVEAVELKLREIVARNINGDVQDTPSHVSAKVQERIEREIKRKAAKDASFYQSIEGRLEFFDLRACHALGARTVCTM